MIIDRYTMSLISIHNSEQITEIFTSLREPSYRVKQLYISLYQNFITDIDEIMNFSLVLRKELKTKIRISTLETAVIQKSKKDKTVKFLFKTDDNKLIESVLMRHLSGRNTVCISSQIGCAMGCKFCSTGKMGLTRNLTSFEIIDQIMAVERFLNNEDGTKVTNIVFMGMGEPLMNYENVMIAVDVFCNKEKLNLSTRHVTISTSGIETGIRKMTTSQYKVNLALSLHSADSRVRSQLMPINNTFPLEKVMKAIDSYTKLTKRRVFYEYIMIDGRTDTKELAYKLVDLLKSRLAHVNLIPYNPANNKDKFKKSTKDNMIKFSKILEKRGVTSSIRYTLGDDIDAACGQLATKFKK